MRGPSRLEPSDDLDALTDLLHRAYAPLAAQGLRFMATWQDEETTAERTMGKGRECWVAREGEAVVGVISLQDPSRCDADWYGRPEVISFGQWAVEPRLQGKGIGRLLLDKAEARARERGFEEIACDTAAPAADLIATYARRGYRLVGRVDWAVTNYESVILSKRLVPA